MAVNIPLFFIIHEIFTLRIKTPSPAVAYESLHFHNLLWLLDSDVMVDWDFGSDADSSWQLMFRLYCWYASIWWYIIMSHSPPSLMLKIDRQKLEFLSCMCHGSKYLIFITGLVKSIPAVSTLVCPDLFGSCLSRFANIYFGPST